MKYLRALIRWLFKGGEAPPDDFEDLDGPDGPHGRPTV